MPAPRLPGACSCLAATRSAPPMSRNRLRAERLGRCPRAPLSVYGQRVIRLVSALIVGAVLTGFAFLLLTGQYVNDGPVMVAVSPTHGIHLGDLFILMGWATGMLAVSALAVMPKRSSMRGADGDPAERQPASER